MPKVNRVLIVTLDGLRPDFVTAEQMPFLASLAARGTRLLDYHAAYPPHTRVQVTTLATGTYPGSHGIVANVMLVPGAGSDHIVDTSNYQHLASLDAVTGGRAVLVPTLSELLALEDRRLAIAASSSPGSTILWTRTHPYRVVNPRTTFGLPDLVALREKLGEPPDPAGPQMELAEYAVRAALAAVAARARPFAVPLDGFGAFPDPRNPRVVWAGAAAVPPLVRLQAEVEAELEPLGFPRDRRPFRPHLTLGRARDGARARDFAGFAALLASLPYHGTLRAEAVTLLRSTLTPAGARYDAVGAPPLGAPDA